LTQVHITPELREQAKEFDIPVMQYDGIAEVWLDSLDDWRAIVSDPEFVKNIAGESFLINGCVSDRRAADEPLFIESPIHIQLSYDNLVIPEKD
jgi:EthD domain